VLHNILQDGLPTISDRPSALKFGSCPAGMQAKVSDSACASGFALTVKYRPPASQRMSSRDMPSAATQPDVAGSVHARSDEHSDAALCDSFPAST